jgi:FkbM family methyltransferase
MGANVGFMAMLAARKVAPGGRVVCFEPLAEPAAQILHNARLNDFPFVEVHQVALARGNGEAEFFVSKESTWGRLSQAGPAPLQSGVIRVPMRTLDAFVNDEKLPAPQFIKMDVEGVEADVIAGGKRVLGEARPVMVIELHHTYAAVSPLLEELGYAMLPLTSNGQVVSMDGEFQLLAYPRERTDVEAVCTELAAGRTVFE